MKIQLDRRGMHESEAVDCRKAEVYIGEVRFTLTEEHGELFINKYNPLDSSSISIKPHVSNVIGLI